MYGARFLVSGEVVGQRPMSQRRDALNVISREAGVRDLLLRPLSAKSLPVTPMEADGLVNRDKLHAFSGRGRNNQLGLAEHLGVSEIPHPGRRLPVDEKESAKRYWPLLSGAPGRAPADFNLANVGGSSGSGRTGWPWAATGPTTRPRGLAEPGISSSSSSTTRGRWDLPGQGGARSGTRT